MKHLTFAQMQQQQQQLQHQQMQQQQQLQQQQHQRLIPFSAQHLCLKFLRPYVLRHCTAAIFV
jgi:hypothetical protein